MKTASRIGPAMISLVSLFCTAALLHQQEGKAQVAVTQGTATGPVMAIEGPEVVPGQSEYLYRVYMATALPEGQLPDWEVQIVYPATANNEAQIIGNTTTGEDGGRRFYEVTVRFKNTPAVIELRFVKTQVGKPATTSGPLTIIVVTVDVDTTNLNTTFIQEGANRQPLVQAHVQPDFVADVVKEPAFLWDPSVRWVTSYIPGYMVSTFVYQYIKHNGQWSGPLDPANKAAREAVWNETATQGTVAIQASASITLTAPPNHANAIGDIECGFIQNSGLRLFPAWTSAYRYVDPAHLGGPAKTSCFTPARWLAGDWLPTGGNPDDKVAPAIMTSGQETFAQALQAMGIADVLDQEDNGWPWYGAPQQARPPAPPPQGEASVTGNTLSMNDSPSRAIPIPRGPLGPVPAFILANSWQKNTYTLSVCARTKKRHFEKELEDTCST